MQNIVKKILQNRILAAVVVIALAAGVYASYQAFFQKNASATQYITAKVQRGTLVVSVTGSGQISSSNQVSIIPQISGNIVNVLATNNQKVEAGELLVKIDDTNDARAVRNAKANLESAQLSLTTLMQPAATSSILQAQGNAAQAKQSLQAAQNNLSTDYQSAYTDISNTFIDLAIVMTGLNNTLYGTSINKVQGDIDAYSNMIAAYYPSVTQYNSEAANAYQTALAAYNQNLTDYKSTNIYSGTSTIESLLDETYATLKTISAANASAKNLLDIVNNVLQQNSQKTPSQLNTDETNMQSYITTTNGHLAVLLQRQNALQMDKQSVASAALSIEQSAAALAQLLNGPTDLAIQAQQLSITQAKNALADAEQNLSYDSVRAPFAGTVTNITAKIAQAVGPSTVLATLLADEQLAQATFNEVDVVGIKVGQKATITFDALPNITLTGKVSQVDTIGTISQGVVSYNVQVALDIPNPTIKPGMSDTVSIITNIKQDVLLAPNSAVSTKQGLSFVQIISANGTPSGQQVTIGLSNDTMTEITSGLTEGDTVVTQTINKTTTQTQTQSSGLRIPGLGGFGGGR